MRRLAPSFAVCFLLVACADDGGSPGNGVPAELADVIFEGTATPGELEALLAEDPVKDPRGGIFTSPAEPADYLPGDAPPVFRVSQRMDGGKTLFWFATDTTPMILRAFTSKTSYEPDAAAWEKLTLGEWVNVRSISAAFENDAIAKDGGPFFGEAFFFCSMPER